MAVWALGINHTTAPLDLRGRFAFAIDQIEPTLRGLRESLARQPEAALISTCNRTEIYCAGENPSWSTRWTGWPTLVVSPRPCCAPTPTHWKTALPLATPFGWPVDWTPWCWVNPKFWANSKMP